MAIEFVLDSSALLALLNAEAGQNIVLDSLPKSVISSVNLAEVITRLSIRGMPERDIRETLGVLGLDILPFNDEQAFHAGLLAKQTHSVGLSLGDRACLALAIATKTVALTADKTWGNLDIDVDIRLVR